VRDGLLIYMPVYGEGGDIPDTAQDRARLIAGFAYMPLRIHDVMVGVFRGGDQRPPVEFEVRAGGKDGPAVYATADLAGLRGPRTSYTLEIGGESWGFECVPTAALGADAQRRWVPLVAAAGVLVSLLLVSVTAAISGAWARADRAAAALRASGQNLREVAERFRVALKNAPITVYNAGLDLRYTWVANAPPGISPEALIGQRDDEVFPPEQARELMDLKRRVLASGAGERRALALRTDGEDRYFDITIEPLLGPGGAVEGLTAAAVDLTERKRAEDDLSRHAASLARSNADLEDFAYIASHDLKEPLRGISNYAKFIQEDFAHRLPADGVERVETISRLAQHMYGLLDSLLEYSRVGRTELAVSEVDLDDVVRSVLAGLSGRLEQEHAQVRIVGDLPRVRADRVRVGQVFANLITNAMKYNTSDPKLVEVGSAPGRRGDRTTPIFYVRDNGIGIEARHHDRIFTMFKRLHGRNQYGGGTGSGLAIAKKIVERHGGRIWVESEKGKGTTFFFTLEPFDRDLPLVQLAAGIAASPVGARGS
jgi:PAS domain S-box-containing protein